MALQPSRLYGSSAPTFAHKLARGCRGLHEPSLPADRGSEPSRLLGMGADPDADPSLHSSRSSTVSERPRPTPARPPARKAANQEGEVWRQWGRQVTGTDGPTHHKHEWEGLAEERKGHGKNCGIGCHAYVPSAVPTSSYTMRA
jgi:hypothetical protein